MVTDGILQGLTSEQREAVTHKDGPMLVVAGAGSGKTRVVTRRIAWLIEQGVRSNEILAMTFTNKAAGEMKERVQALTGETPRWVGTFHSLCAKFLRFDIEALRDGRDGRFTIFDTTDQQGVIKELMKSHSVDDKRFKPRSIGSEISRAKCDMISPTDFGDGSWYSDVVQRVYAGYERRLRDMNALDFDDLLLLTAKLLQTVPELREQYRRRFRYLLIDEYQDTNKVQYKLMKSLCNEMNNVHVTGDPDQSIYSWRGADYSNIMDFQKDFPQARIVRLERNYRSSDKILSAANHLIKYNTDRIDKSLYTEETTGEPVAIIALESDREEANWVAEQAARLKSEGSSFSNMAIFYRTNAQSRMYEEAFMSAGMPYQIVGGVRFYERKEIKDFLSHLKLLVNTRDEIALRRVLSARPTGVGPKTLEKVVVQAELMGISAFELLASPNFIEAYEGRTTAKLRDFSYWCNRLKGVPLAPVGDSVRELLRVSGLMEHISASTEKDPAWEERLENLEAFVGRAAEFEADHPDSSLPEFLEDVALVADVDSYDPNADNITLMTLHSAKGLEFPTVFLGGLENGLLPHSNSQDSIKNEEEERRLFYVGITRAEKKLFITHASKRLIWGKLEYSRPSPFLGELPTEEMQLVDLAGGSGAYATKQDDTFGDFDDGFDDGFGDEFADPFGDDFDGIDIGFEEISEPPSRLRKKKKEEYAFKSGERVTHKTLGSGRVLSCSRTHIVVMFDKEGTRMMTLDSVKLTKG